MMLFIEKRIGKWILLFICIVVSCCSLYNCQLYREICIPHLNTINSLIGRAIARQNEHQHINEFNFSSWSHVETLYDLCKKIGMPDFDFPKLLIFSKPIQRIDGQVHVIMSVREWPKRQYKDIEHQSGFDRWFQYEFSRYPFNCNTCRMHIKLLVHKLNYTLSKFENIKFTFGLMDNRYPLMVDPKRFAAILEQDKSLFKNLSIKLGHMNDIKRVKREDVKIVEVTIAPPKDHASSWENNMQQQFLNKEMLQSHLQSLNMTVFGQRNQLFLLGALSKDGSSLLNGTRFVLEYSICMGFDTRAGFFYPLDNCIAYPFEDKLQGQNRTYIGGECVCWKKSALKPLVFTHLIFLSGLFTLVCIFKKYSQKQQAIVNQLKQIRCLSPKLNSFSKVTKNVTPKATKPSSPPFKIFYQLLMQIHGDSVHKGLLQGCIKVRLLALNGHCILEHLFTAQNSFLYQPSFEFPDILQINCFFSSPQPLPPVHLIVLQYIPFLHVQRTTTFQSGITLSKTINTKSTTLLKTNSKTTLQTPLDLSMTQGPSSNASKSNTRISNFNTPSNQIVNFSQRLNTVKPIYVFGLIFTCGHDIHYHYVFPYGNYTEPNAQIRLSEVRAWYAYINRQQPNIGTLRDLLPLKSPDAHHLGDLKLFFIRVYFIIESARLAKSMMIENELPAWLYLLPNLVYSFTLNTLFLILHNLQIGPAQHWNFMFVRMNYIQLEFKIILPFLTFIIGFWAQEKFLTLRNEVWSIPFATNQPHLFEQQIFHLDLIWMFLFFTILIIFIISFKITQHLIVKYIGEKPNSGPIEAIEERMGARVST